VQYPDRIVLYSPEFLSETTAAYDVEHPFSNILGLVENTPESKIAADTVMKVLPLAPHAIVCSSLEAELIKYSHNGSGYIQVVFFNLMYDLAQKMGADWKAIEDALDADPMISNRYAHPIHKTGRGAGGHCFIKDFKALAEVYAQKLPEDAAAAQVFQAVSNKNVDLLVKSKKDLDLVRGVYGEEIISKHSASK
jgi:UDPglucose 6-dehydrogenase